MIKYQWISVDEIDKTLFQITLKRTEKRNALSIEMMDELYAAFISLQQLGCQVVILTAEGKTFCTGADLYEVGDPNLTEPSIASLARLFTTIFTSQMVTICAVQGDALGGGGGIVAACDLVIASKAANFAFPETRRGLIAAQVATLLVRQINIRHIRELLLTGEPISAGRAYEIGLVNRVVENIELMNEAKKMARDVLLGAPEAIKMTKRLIADVTAQNFSADLQHSISIYRIVGESKEARQRISSFIKRN